RAVFEVGIVGLSGVSPARAASSFPRPASRGEGFTASVSSIETPCGVGEHGVDLARLRGEIAARQHLAAVVARDFLEQPLELADIAVDGALEIAVGAIALADFLERLLALHGVEPAREHVAFAALVAVPQLGRRVVVDHAGDVDGERIERVDGVALGARGLGRCFAWRRSLARQRRLARGRLGFARGGRGGSGPRTPPGRPPPAGAGLSEGASPRRAGMTGGGATPVISARWRAGSGRGLPLVRGGSSRATPRRAAVSTGSARRTTA